MSKSESRLVLIRDSMHNRVTELAESHDLSIIDTVTYALAYIYSLDIKERDHVIEKGSGLFILLDMHPDLKLDMPTEEFRAVVLKGLDDVLSKEDNI